MAWSNRVLFINYTCCQVDSVRAEMANELDEKKGQIKILQQTLQVWIFCIKTSPCCQYVKFVVGNKLRYLLLQRNLCCCLFMPLSSFRTASGLTVLCDVLSRIRIRNKSFRIHFTFYWLVGCFAGLVWVTRALWWSCSCLDHYCTNGGGLKTATLVPPPPTNRLPYEV